MDARRMLDGIDGALGVSGVDEGAPVGDGTRTVELHTARGPVELRSSDAPGATAGVVWVGGVGGGFDSPARGLYPAVASALVGERVASVRVRFRHPGDLEESVHDCLAGLWYLRQRGATRLAAVGHSFGGAVVVRAAAADPSVRTIITLATQSYGADAVVELTDRCSLLAVHGGRDDVLPDTCSRRLRESHGGFARLLIFDDAGHVLDEVADEVREVVSAWLFEELDPEA